MARVAIGISALLLLGALSLWWAGFAPFPTKPVVMASYHKAGTCVMRDYDWSNCSPQLSNPAPSGSLSAFRLFTDSASKSWDYGEYGQWGVEGWDGCWDGGCDRIHVSMGTWTRYIKSEVPHFGLGSPRWLLVVASYKAMPLDGDYAQAAYTTYGACMYRRPSDTDDVYYKCERIAPDEPWRVGTLRK